MCGIAGVFSFGDKSIVNQSLISRMTDIISHRGPDDFGYYINDRIGLGHRRLSIIDLSSMGHQPFFDETGRYAIVFNGEIFNYKELREKLELKGISFKTRTDTEVLLKIFILMGLDCLEMLNGMFAFAIWDDWEKKITLVRDRIGVKPLYYSIENDNIYFGSEIKSILTAGISKELNHECADEHLLFRYIAGENTIFKKIKRLLPGHCLQITVGGDMKPIKWWDLKHKIIGNRKKISPNPFLWFEELFNSAVDYRTISDVPIGLMLSGGLDSGSVAVALSNTGHKNLSSFTIEFDDALYNEGDLAKQVAEKFNFNYFPVKVNNDELLNELEEATWLLDEPLVHYNDPQILKLSKVAAKQVKVLLSGEGGDEFMGGYVRYKPLKYSKLFYIARIISKFLSKFGSNSIVNRFDKLNRYLKERKIDNLVLLNVADIYPVDLSDFNVHVKVDSLEYRLAILNEAKSIYPKELSRQAMYLDLFTHMASILDRNDRMTMGAGIECRVPFMDYRLMEAIPSLPSKYLLKGKKGKFLLFNSIAKSLPTEVRKFKKLGLSVPWDSFLLNNAVFIAFINSLENSQQHVFYKSLDIPKLMISYNKGDIVAKVIIKQLFMFDIWYNSYYKKF